MYAIIKLTCRLGSGSLLVKTNKNLLHILQVYITRANVLRPHNDQNNCKNAFSGCCKDISEGSSKIITLHLKDIFT